MKERLRGLRNDPAPPLLSPAGPREAIPMLRNGWKQLTRVVASVAGQGKVLWGCPMAGSPDTALCSRVPMVLPGCSSGTAHILTSSPCSGNAMLSPAPPNHHRGNPNSSSPLTSWLSNP